MFGLFGNKKGNSATATAPSTTSATQVHFKDDASALRHELHRIQEELSTVLESKGRATKDERTVIVTSSLDTFRKVDNFLAKYTK
tara:strand:- start:9449 stop:9703 length:255 start_codon:yes stop_codon:yes gene_type:complete